MQKFLTGGTVSASLCLSASPALIHMRSMARLGIFWGLEAPREKLMFFSELATGWTFSFPWFFIEPRVTILDAFSSEEGRIAELEKAIPQYSKIRISLLVGVEIP